MKSLHQFKFSLSTLIVFFFMLSENAGFSQNSIKLPWFFRDNMVLQREKPIKLWGTSAPKKVFEMEFCGEKRKVKADESGKWRVEFTGKEAGGPFEMKILSDSSFSFKNILIGDVYMCSGQSNMEWKLFQAFNASHELRIANFPEIRNFTVPKCRSLTPFYNVLPSIWTVTTPHDAASYSALAYFFAKNIHLWEKVPVGLIDNSWGGTPIEYWTSLESLATHPDYQDNAKQILAQNIQNLSGKDKNKSKILPTRDVALAGSPKEIPTDKGMEEKWYSPDYKPVDWLPFTAPGYWENQGLKAYDGVVWFRKSFSLPPQMAGKELLLNLEILNNFETTYFNGVEIGYKNWAPARRNYIVPANLVKAGKNLIALRITNTNGYGGFESKDENDLRIQELIEPDEPVIVPLSGDWLMKPVAVPVADKTKSISTSDYNVPAGIYNAMVAPFADLSIKGILWYQGETNSFRAYQYQTLFQLMINDWRKQFKQGDLPFLFVQLSACGALTENPVESSWAELREAQTMALSLPNTGMAVTIDVGNPYDVHPTNKQEVARRLAIEAEKVVYGKTELKTSPVYKDMKIDGNKIRISFANVPDGLCAHYGDLKGFAVAGEDKKFIWAKAEIQGNQVVVWSDQVKLPLAVRYAWTASPIESNGANLFTDEGFPVSPFRTDLWDGMTKNNK